jgi:hypothetical protein
VIRSFRPAAISIGAVLASMVGGCGAPKNGSSREEMIVEVPPAPPASATAEPARPLPRMATTTAPVERTPGTCERYFVLFEACMEKTLAGLPPGPQRDSLRTSMEDVAKQMRELFRDMPPETVEPICSTALEALEEQRCPS